jgi:hypothetical protein
MQSAFSHAGGAVVAASRVLHVCTYEAVQVKCRVALNNSYKISLVE